MTDAAIAAGLAAVHCPARIEVLQQAPLVILDCAHNPASVQALLNTLCEMAPEHFGEDRNPQAKRTLLFASSRDKDIPGMLSLLKPHFDRICFTRYARSDRCADETELREAMGEPAGWPGPVYVENPREAWQRTMREAGESDAICITGSVFLAGDIRAMRDYSPPKNSSELA